MAVGALALSGLLVSADAQACGGCFTLPSADPSQVVGHRMILSISNDKTTLWDQIAYAGSPESFAWVLPIHGQVDIGVSSDALFGQLEQVASVHVVPVYPECANQGCYQEPGGTFTTTSTTGVTVIAQETVGPYETVQLSSVDPLALEVWLDSHGYAVSDDIVPVIAAYVDEGFDFLAIKLVPGKDVSSMVPVRVTSPGAGLGLPLRMVAAGTGAITPITLWIAGEGRYEPANFPSFTIDPEKLVWNWDTYSSNYDALRKLGFQATNQKGWLVELSEPASPDSIGSLVNAVANFPVESGYGDNEAEAVEACQADLDVLYGSLDASSFWITRLHAELPKAALATDLAIGASMDQSQVPSYMVAPNSVGTFTCPEPCEGTSSTSSGTAGGGTGGGGTAGGDGASGGNGGGMSGGCAVGSSETTCGPEAIFGAAMAALGAATALRRKRRGQSGA
jgi:hypothetical protein